MCERKSVVEKIWKTEFNPTYLYNLTNQINNIFNETTSFNRLGSHQELQEGFRKGGRAYVAASIIAQRSGSTSTETELSCDATRYQSLIQELLIEAWASNNNYWIENSTAYLKSKYGDYIAKGGESVVYLSGSYVIKEWKTGRYESLQLALDRIAIHNTLFPTTIMEVISFGRDYHGNFVCIIKQPFIKVATESLDTSEVIEYMSDLGFDELDVTESAYNTHTDFINADFWVADLHKENVLKTPEGNIEVIDAWMYLNTPGLGYDGEFQILPPEEWERGDENDWTYPVFPIDDPALSL